MFGVDKDKVDYEILYQMYLYRSFPTIPSQQKPCTVTSNVEISASKKSDRYHVDNNIKRTVTTEREIDIKPPRISVDTDDSSGISKIRKKSEEENNERHRTPYRISYIDLTGDDHTVGENGGQINCENLSKLTKTQKLEVLIKEEPVSPKQHSEDEHETIPLCPDEDERISKAGETDGLTIADNSQEDVGIVTQAQNNINRNQYNLSEVLVDYPIIWDSSFKKIISKHKLLRDKAWDEISNIMAPHSKADLKNEYKSRRSLVKRAFKNHGKYSPKSAPWRFLEKDFKEKSVAVKASAEFQTADGKMMGVDDDTVEYKIPFKTSEKYLNKNSTNLSQRTPCTGTSNIKPEGNNNCETFRFEQLKEVSPHDLGKKIKEMKSKTPFSFETPVQNIIDNNLKCKQTSTMEIDIKPPRTCLDTQDYHINSLRHNYISLSDSFKKRRIDVEEQDDRNRTPSQQITCYIDLTGDDQTDYENDEHFQQNVCNDDDINKESGDQKDRGENSKRTQNNTIKVQIKEEPIWSSQNSEDEYETNLLWPEETECGDNITFIKKEPLSPNQQSEEDYEAKLLWPDEAENMCNVDEIYVKREQIEDLVEQKIKETQQNSLHETFIIGNVSNHTELFPSHQKDMMQSQKKIEGIAKSLTSNHQNDSMSSISLLNKGTSKEHLASSQALTYSTETEPLHSTQQTANIRLEENNKVAIKEEPLESNKRSENEYETNPLCPDEADKMCKVDEIHVKIEQNKEPVVQAIKENSLKSYHGTLKIGDLSNQTKLFPSQKNYMIQSQKTTEEIPTPLIHQTKSTSILSQINGGNSKEHLTSSQALTDSTETQPLHSTTQQTADILAEDSNKEREPNYKSNSHPEPFKEALKKHLALLTDEYATKSTSWRDKKLQRQGNGVAFARFLQRTTKQEAHINKFHNQSSTSSKKQNFEKRTSNNLFPVETDVVSNGVAASSQVEEPNYVPSGENINDTTMPPNERKSQTKHCQSKICRVHWPRHPQHRHKEFFNGILPTVRFQYGVLSVLQDIQRARPANLIPGFNYSALNVLPILQVQQSYDPAPNNPRPGPTAQILSEATGTGHYPSTRVAVGSTQTPLPTNASPSSVKSEFMSEN